MWGSALVAHHCLCTVCLLSGLDGGPKTLTGEGPIRRRAKKLIHRIGADVSCRGFPHPSLPWASLVLFGPDHVGWLICRWPSPSTMHPDPVSGPERHSPVLYPSAVPVPEGHHGCSVQAASSLRQTLA